MGSFNVACSISNLSIDPGMPVAFIPLEVSKYPYKIGDGNHFLIYSRCFYSPVTLPIFGEYADYGHIEDVETDKNVKIIEAHFERPVDEILDPQTYNIPPITSGMFILREVYDLFVKTCIDDFGKPYLQRNKCRRDLENLRKEVKDALRNWGDLFERVGVSPLLNIYSPFMFREYPTLSKIYMEWIMEGGFDEELIDFLRFEAGMAGTNQFYFPAANGWQCGNKYMDVKLHNLAAGIAKKQIKRWED